MAMTEDDALFRPGTYGCHEAMHMALFFADSVDAQLVEHPSIKMNHQWLSMAERAREVLLDLYQAVGGAHLSAADDAKDKPPATIMLSSSADPSVGDLA
jgi:hypothetical protein